MRPHSLRARLVLAAAASILVALAVFGVAAAIVTRHELHATLDRALRQRAGDVARLAVSAPAVLTTPGALEAPTGGRQVVVEVLDRHGRILARSVSLGARLLPRDALVERALRAGRTGYETVVLAGHRVRLFAAPIARASGAAGGGVVVVGSETTDIDTTTHRLELLLVVCGIATAALASALAWLLTSNGLRPLRRLSAGAREIEQTADASRRLPTPSADDEIGELTAVLNRMLGVLEQARLGERRFLADASHELRTPVTALLGNVEYAARHGASAEVVADLRADARRLARLVDDLLVLERAEASPGTAVRLDDLAREAAAAHEAVRLARAEEVAVTGDREALLRAVRNLTENALVHGPAGGPVDVEAGTRDGQAYLLVRDTGPGPAPADHEHLFERFWRGPATADRPGSGLGLAIVAAIVERHGGTVTVEGSTFTIVLPRVGEG